MSVVDGARSAGNVAAHGRLAGKVALVTGSTQGLGEGIALRLAREGASLIVHGRSEVRGNAVATAMRALGAAASFIRADLTDKQAAQDLVAAAASRFGRLDILVNNAQVVPRLIETSDDANDGCIDVAMRSGL